MSLKRIIALAAIYCLTCLAWVFLGGITHSRTISQKSGLSDEVASLWGQPHTQGAPSLKFRAISPSSSDRSDSVSISKDEAQTLKLVFPPPPPLPYPNKPPHLLTKEEIEETKKAKEAADILWVRRAEPTSVPLSASLVDAKLGSDPRRKGLVWYPLYDVWFQGEYRYEHQEKDAGYLDVELALPTADALYDGLHFEVNGKDRRGSLDPTSGRFSLSTAVQPGDVVEFRLAYKSRGTEEWRYLPGVGVQQLENFKMTMATDFHDIDFPSQTLSPTAKTKTPEGWALSWDFASTITGHGMGMRLPAQIQPGELSSELIFSAPISLMFFFVMLFVVATLQKLEIHPINYLFLAAAFFAFHLLFSYSADHLTVPWAFGVSSVVSLLLVVSYLRLVVSPKFALREAALGQLIYLVGFSLAHFWEGYTGLTVTVLAILTLFLLMQATGRLRWAEVLESGAAKKDPPGPKPSTNPVELSSTV
jgi:hypothetical protein